MSNTERKMVPYPHHKLVLVKESSGLEKVHIRLSQEARELMLEYAKRFPHITWITHTAEDPSHRYPEKEEDRELTYYIGQIFIELGSLINDPEEIAPYMLMVAAAISLSVGKLIDEDLVATFAKPPVIETEVDLSVWEQVDVSSLERRQAIYTEESKSASYMIEHATKTPLPDSHPFPESDAEKKTALRLRILFEELMNTVGVHDARNFLLASAARLLQLGAISNTALEKIHRSYKNALDRWRNGRMYEEPPTSSDGYNDDEDENNLLPWGNISW